MANKQAKEKQQKRQEYSTRLMMSRLDMEEVRKPFAWEHGRSWERVGGEQRKICRSINTKK